MLDRRVRWTAQRSGAQAVAARLLRPAARAATPSTRASSTRRGVGLRRAALPARPRAAAVHHQGRARRRPGRQPALGHRPHRAARPLHPLLPDLVHDRAARSAGSTPTRAGSGCSSAGRRSTARRASGRATASSSRSRSGRSSASGRLRRRLRRSGAHCVPGGGMSSHVRLAMIDARRADRRLLHAHLRAAPGRGRRARMASGPRLRRELGARADRGGRAGRQHPRHARADRARPGARA